MQTSRKVPYIGPRIRRLDEISGLGAKISLELLLRRLRRIIYVDLYVLLRSK